MRFVEHLGECDEVEEEGEEGCRDSDTTPVGAVEECSGQNREGCDAIEKNSDF